MSKNQQFNEEISRVVYNVIGDDLSYYFLDRLKLLSLDGRVENQTKDIIQKTINCYINSISLAISKEYVQSFMSNLNIANVFYHIFRSNYLYDAVHVYWNEELKYIENSEEIRKILDEIDIQKIKLSFPLVSMQQALRECFLLLPLSENQLSSINSILDYENLFLKRLLSTHEIQYKIDSRVIQY